MYIQYTTVLNNIYYYFSNNKTVNCRITDKSSANISIIFDR